MDPSYSNPAFGAGAGGQPQQPVFGSGGVQAPISSGTGDIVLAPEKKSRKGVIVALVVAVLIIGGLFAAVFLIRGDGNVNLSEDAKLAFNKYANYLLYEEDSNSKLEGEYDENGSGIYTVLASGNEPEIKKYANNLKTLWYDFSDLVGNFNISDGQSLNDYNDRLNFIMTYMLNTRESMERKIINLLLSGSGDNLDGAVENYLGQFSSYNFDEANNYRESSEKYYKMYGDLMVKLKNAGCLKEDGDVDMDNTGCFSMMLDEEENNMAMEEESANMENEVSEVAIYLVKNCWEISNVINGGEK